MNKLSTKHVKRMLAKVRHKGFEVVIRENRRIVAFEGSIKLYDTEGGARFVYVNPFKLLKTVRMYSNW